LAPDPGLAVPGQSSLICHFLLPHVLGYHQLLLRLDVHVLAGEMLVFVRLKHVATESQYDLQANVRYVLDLDDVPADVLAPVLNTDDVENPNSDGRKVSLNEHVKSVNDANGDRIHKQSKPEVPVLLLVVDHAQDEEHYEQRHVDERRPVNRHYEQGK
jgi:hypothetical protein